MKSIIIGNCEDQLAPFFNAAAKLDYLPDPKSFPGLDEAWRYLQSNGADMVVLDINSLGELGIKMGTQIRSVYHDVRLLYITGAETYHYVLEAVRVNVGAYILIPYTAEDLDYAIKASDLFLNKKNKKHIFARTFGYFDLFVDDTPIPFRSSKAKELLAMLIDRQGGIVTSDQAIGTLWENRANDEMTQSLYSKVGRSLQNQLDEAGAGHIIILSRGSRSISVDSIDCDLYRLLNGDKEVKHMYFGQYMMDYSWAEYRQAGLERFLTN
ncbi:hypothetical protein [Cloacibacillus sp.]|uniref:hypothetical protein n=1 Tax=Cloacibacillus sp. TaxID=2049023 RepID=UPI0025B91212|nr:hypothetical protein [Cloacibacillus sp.]MCC8057117.1 hypothetical protein [Cloacibacillus sp.]MCC8179234.1 hypothetical protein [Cloacibacillus sp.]